LWFHLHASQVGVRLDGGPTGNLGMRPAALLEIQKMAEPGAERPVTAAQCALYKPGHQVHFIQVRLTALGEQRENRRGQLVSIDEAGWISVAVEGKVERFWTHDPSRAREAFLGSGGKVGLPGYGTLYAEQKKGRRYLCVATEAEGATPCLHPLWRGASVEDLAGRLESSGGFMVSGRELQESQ
jgi:hypothetical protein